MSSLLALGRETLARDLHALCSLEGKVTIQVGRIPIIIRQVGPSGNDGIGARRVRTLRGKESGRDGFSNTCEFGVYAECAFDGAAGGLLLPSLPA